MLVSDAHRFLFLPIPRTASMSMRHVIGPLTEGRPTWYRGPRPLHPPITAVLAERPALADYFKFAFVRNPFDRFVSLYHWHIFRDPRRKFPGPYTPVEYLRCLLADEPWAFSMLSYIGNADGEVLVDFVGRFENLADDWAQVCVILEVDTPMQHHHYTGCRSPYRDFWCPESRALIEEHCAEDLALFEYGW